MNYKHVLCLVLLSVTGVFKVYGKQNNHREKICRQALQKKLYKNNYDDVGAACENSVSFDYHVSFAQEGMNQTGMYHLFMFLNALSNHEAFQLFFINNLNISVASEYDDCCDYEWYENEVDAESRDTSNQTDIVHEQKEMQPSVDHCPCMEQDWHSCAEFLCNDDESICCEDDVCDLYDMTEEEEEFCDQLEKPRPTPVHMKILMKMYDYILRGLLMCGCSC